MWMEVRSNAQVEDGAGASFVVCVWPVEGPVEVACCVRIKCTIVSLFYANDNEGFIMLTAFMM